MSTENAIREKLERIEERQKRRRALFEEKKNTLIEESREAINKTEEKLIKQAVNATVIMAVTAFTCIFLLEILIRVHLNEEINFLILFRNTASTIPFLSILVIVFVILNRRTRIQFTELCNALEEVSKGNYDYRLPIKDAGIFKEAYCDFNEMCENIKGINDDLSGAVVIANEASAAKSKFLSNMSHEIRTPINAVLGLDEMIIRESKEKIIRGYAKDIKSAGGTLLSLINDILDTSKIEAGKLEIIPSKYDLCSLINDISNMFIKQTQDKGLEFIIRVDEKTPHLLKGDDVRIKQCILNILSNAVKYTDEGSVTMEVGFAKTSAKEILLTVSIADTGRGMKQADMERLFAPFERIEEEKTRYIEGTGLGMNITRNLLKLMDSELRVDSKYGEGSTFRFSVREEVLDWEPVGKIEESFARLRDSEGKYRESFHAPQARLLIVDDSSVNLMIVEGLLKKTEMQMDLVESGREAIKLSSEKKYDLILVDHMMPDMDGIETLHHIREDGESMNKDSVIIALTANVVAGARENYLKEGFNDYLGKPIEPEKLEAAIRNFLPKELLVFGEFEDTTEEEDVANAREVNTQMPDEPEEVTEESNEDEFIIKLRKVHNIFPDTGLEYSGSLQLYKKVVEEYTDTGRSRADLIEQLFEQEDVRNYTIQVHALKSASRVIGATVLSRLAAALEEAGNAGNMTRIKNGTPELLNQYRQLVAQLEQVIDSGEDLPIIDESSLRDALASIREMADGFDFDSVDMVMQELKKYRMPDNFKENYQKLKNLVAEVARDDILLLIDNL